MIDKNCGGVVEGVHNRKFCISVSLFGQKDLEVVIDICTCRWITEQTYWAQAQRPRVSRGPTGLHLMNVTERDTYRPGRDSKWHKIISERPKTTTKRLKMTTKWHKTSTKRLNNYKVCASCSNVGKPVGPFACLCPWAHWLHVTPSRYEVDAVGASCISSSQEVKTIVCYCLQGVSFHPMTAHLSTTSRQPPLSWCCLP